MRSLLRVFAAVILLQSAPLILVVQAGVPDPTALKLVAQLPPELPQRIKGFAYDGEKLWATIYLGQGRYATLDPTTLQWEADYDDEHYNIIRNVAGAFASPGGICFAKDSIWIIGAYGESFGSIDRHTWRVGQIFKGKQQPEDKASQSYSSVAYDGNHLWIV